jgi:hypothetical protein
MRKRRPGRFRDNETNAWRRLAGGFFGGLDANAAAAQLPGYVRRAVFVGEQPAWREDESRAFADVAAQAGQRG